MEAISELVTRELKTFLMKKSNFEIVLRVRSRAKRGLIILSNITRMDWTILNAV
jgi:hypothetical protein